MNFSRRPPPPHYLLIRLGGGGLRPERKKFMSILFEPVSTKFSLLERLNNLAAFGGGGEEKTFFSVGKVDHKLLKLCS